MSDFIFSWLNQYLSREWAVFLTACLPIVELRGAIPLAIALGISPWKAYFLSVAGNTVPVIPLLLYLRPIRLFIINNFSFMESFFAWLDKRTISKSDQIEKYGAVALILFTAVPLPTTGAWTASLAALLFKIKFRYAFPAILAGIILAGIIVTILSLTGKAIF